MADVLGDVFITYNLTNCTETSSNPTTAYADSIFNVILTANAGYIIQQSDITIAGGTLQSLTNTSGQNYTLTILTSDNFTVNVTVVASTPTKYLDTQGLHQVTTRIKTYTEGRTTYYITEATTNTDSFDFTIVKEG